MPYRIGIDIGGTFTDISLFEMDGDKVFTHKVASTPRAPSRAVALGVTEVMKLAGSTPAAISSFIHGTTIGLNAILERRGQRIKLFVSEGNRDILEIGRLHKPDLFNLRATLPAALVARRDVVEIPGRMSAAGEEVFPFDAEAARREVEALEKDITSVAICFLGAHRNSAHEEAMATIFAELRPDVHVSRSSEIWPEVREYERAMVAVLNAYVQPVLSRYLDNLITDTSEIGIDVPLFITRSNGGVMSARTARTLPVATLLSGPASGVVGAAHIALESGIQEVVTLDIGGTSADVSVIRNGVPIHSTEAWAGDFPLITPSVDVFAVGAGGGSIAWFDELGLLKLGPKSAGAEPGPACYDNGGADPTMTDAYLVCGYIDPDNFVGGKIRLNRKKAEEAIEPIAQRLAIGLEAAAESILKVATSTMASAILPMTTKRGIEPRDFTLIAFGGAGPTHACLLSEEIGLSQILVPPTPGTMCATGAALADASDDYIRSLRKPLELVDETELEHIYGELEDEAWEWLKSERPDAEEVEIWRAADMRYRGQAFNVEIELQAEVAGGYQENLRSGFHDAYDRLYGNADRSQPMDLINLRVRITGKSQRPPAAVLVKAPEGDTPRPRTRRDITYGGKTMTADVFDRGALLARQRIKGPAIIEQFDTTTVVAPGFAARVELNGNLIITREN